MEFFEPANPDIESPVLPIEFDGEEILLTWFTARRVMFPYQPQYNHVEFLDNEGDVSAFQSKQVDELLKEGKFPILMMPYVDKATEDWMVMVESQDLEDVDPDFFSNGTDDIFE